MDQPAPGAGAAEVVRGQQAFLRGLARRTWRYFEVLVNAEENWLPPDNLQEVPGPVIASRTSPTNIGMALLANLAAHDFGYLTAGQLLERTEQTLTTMETARTLPRPSLQLVRHAHAQARCARIYVSSVDSGNLLGALATLRAGLLEMKSQPVVSPRLWAGLRDTLELVLADPLRADKGSGRLSEASADGGDSRPSPSQRSGRR